MHRTVCRARGMIAQEAQYHGFAAIIRLAAHAQLGNEESARASAQKLLDCEPNFHIATHLAALYFKNQSDRDHYGQALRTAGLPE